VKKNKKMWDKYESIKLHSKVSKQIDLTMDLSKILLKYLTNL